jgi:hypothetical protein
MMRRCRLWIVSRGMIEAMRLRQLVWPLNQWSALQDHGFEGDFLVDALEFDAALVEDVAAQDDLVSEDVAAVAVNFYRSDGCVADRQIQIGRDTLIGFPTDPLNDRVRTADLQLQAGDHSQRNKCAIGACIEKGVNCGVG